MKVLLCQDVERLGWFGDVVEVKDGYARNYLLPQCIAIVPTEGNIKSLEEEKMKRGKDRQVAHKKLARAAGKVEGAEAVIAAKANEQGHLFGSVAARDIGTNLREQGYEIADEHIRLAEHIKDVGEYSVPVRFAMDLDATVKVVVVAQDENIELGDEPTDTDSE